MLERAVRNFFKGQWSSVAIAAVALLAFSVVFGGASREHALRLALVELAALPLFVFAAGRIARESLWQQHRLALGLLAAMAALPLAQLVPLPPAVWTRLPGRESLVLALDLVRVSPGWSPLTLVPDLTWRSALALLPAIAMFLAILTVPPGVRKRLTILYILAAVVSVLLGAAQLASGGERLYPWETTSAGSVNGFFANRNHLATFLLMTLPFAIVIGIGALRDRTDKRTPVWLAALFTVLVIVGLAGIRSRAGVLLFVPVLTMSLLAAWIAAGRGRPSPGLLGLLGASGVALTLVAVLALPPILARFDPQSAPEGRFEQWPIVADAAQAYLPVGSGMGSFDTVFRSVEPLQQLSAKFFNQAHNEYLETWLEAGWPGVTLILVFMLWYGRRSWAAWRSDSTSVNDLQRAATIAIGVAVLHSAADYPLRTVTMATLFAMCCAILEFAGRADQGGRSDEDFSATARSPRRRSRRRA